MHKSHYPLPGNCLHITFSVGGCPVEVLRKKIFMFINNSKLKINKLVVTPPFTMCAVCKNVQVLQSLLLKLILMR